MKRNGNDIYKGEFEVGIIGVGGLGCTIAHYAITAFPNVKLNLVGKNYASVLTRVRSIIARQGESPSDIVNEEEAKRRIRVYRTVDGETSFDARGQPLDQKKRLLDSDFIVISARNTGIPFSAFKNRDDEYKSNKQTIREDISPRLRGYKGIAIVATNPLELVCEDVAEFSGISLDRIVGASYIDTIRFRKEVARATYNTIKYMMTESELEKAIVLGGHRPSMVPILSRISVQGQNFNDIKKLNTSDTRKQIHSALYEDPAILQHGGDTAKSLPEPANAIVQTILAFLTSKEITSLVHDGKCFMSYPCKSKDVSGIRVIKSDISILEGLSKSEKRKVLKSRKEILRLKRKKQ